MNPQVAVERRGRLGAVGHGPGMVTLAQHHRHLLVEIDVRNGQVGWLLPISVDGFVVAASMSMLVRRRAGLPAGALAWTSLLAGIGASLAANVAAADPTMVGRVVAAWPPLALLLAWELLLQVRAPTAAGREP